MEREESSTGILTADNILSSEPVVYLTGYVCAKTASI